MKTGLTCAILLCTVALPGIPPDVWASGFEAGRDPYGSSYYASAGNGAGNLRITRFSPVAGSAQPQSEETFSMFSSVQTGQWELGFEAGMAEREHRIMTSATRDGVVAGFFAGSGEDYSQLEYGGSPMDPYFFHGGAAQDFSYRGLAIDLALIGMVNLQFAFSSIESPGFDTRRTSYAGVSTPRYSVGMFSVMRGGDSVTHGMDGNYHSNGFSSHLRQINHESGARYRSIGLSRGGAGDWYGLSIESGRNPLFRDSEENRIMFRWGGSLGSDRFRLNASETVDAGLPEDDIPGQATHRGRNLALLAGAIVAIGAASSSGSETQDNSIRIRSQHEAARETLNRINPLSVRQNREYGGWVYRNRDGTFGYTPPVAGSVASVDIGPKSSVPRGTVASASYHTHGGPDPRYNNEEFSPSDLLSDNLQRVDGYLGTPAGRFLLHEFRTQRIMVLGRIAN